MTAPETKNDEASTDETRSALAALGTTAAVIAFALTLSYLVPAWHSFRPWLWGDPPLIVRHYFETSDSEQAVATGGARTTSTRDRARLERELGREIAVGLETRGEPTHHGPKARIEPREYAGTEHHLVDADDSGMRPFYEALWRTAHDEPHAVTRVAHYGDSSIATDRITSTVRRHLQLRFGDSGHGFVLVSKSYMAYRHIGLEHTSSDGWNAQEVTRRSRNDGRYGYGGIVLRAGAGARATFGTDDAEPVGHTVSRFELWYSTHPRFASVELRIDGGEPRTLSTTGEVGEGVDRIDLPDGPHKLQIRTLGLVELYGVVLERDVPGVVYDSLGLVGARANRLLNFDPAHIRSQIERRGTNLLVLGFGGNEASDTIDPELYEADFERVVARMRSGRTDLGCLVVAPLDQAGRQGGGIRTFRGLPVIVEAQRRVAARAGCAFFDTFTAMGGAGSMARWYRSDPPLASGDFRHATPEGYEVIGHLIYRAILEGFAHWIERAHPEARR